MIAFTNFKKIQQLEKDDDKHREWLKDYEGLYFAIAKEKQDLVYWSKEKEKYVYQDKLWDFWFVEGLNRTFLYARDINKIQRKKNRLVIEFDDENAKENLEIVYNKFKDKGWGFIRSTHKSKNSDYLWVEFNKELTEKEAEKFLISIAPENSTVDLNFKSDAKRFPVLFAPHWKYGTRELPTEYFEGEQIDYNSLDLQTTKRVVRQSKDGYKTARVFSRRGQAEAFIEENPIFYDKSGMFWQWNFQEYCYELTDEVDVLNKISEELDVDTINSKAKTEIVNSLKQVGRQNIPKPIKPTWIQFKDTIIDIVTGERFKATPDYFVVNPIPYELHKENLEATPIMDKIFEEWVGKDYIKTLYQILSYSLIPDYPIHRLFCFIGGGLNGKSKFLELLRKFVGHGNCCSTELDTLLTSRFEVTRLHKKLICQMGETDFSEMNKTSVLKKLTGGDLIGFEYKNKNPFEEINYAKILISTNNLPTTTDKTIGFYRRWLIVDFPNQFSEKKDILGDIPEEEYESLALKCSFILKELLKKREFHKEGTIEERMEKYENKSDFLQKFMFEFIEEDANAYITTADFRKRFNSWCDANKHRKMDDGTVGKKLKEKGFERMRKYFNWLNENKGGQLYCYSGMKWKD